MGQDQSRGGRMGNTNHEGVRWGNTVLHSIEEVHSQTTTQMLCTIKAMVGNSSVLNRYEEMGSNLSALV